MSAPNVQVYLTTPIPGYSFAALADMTSLDSAPEITEAIEAPAEVNRFVAPDVSLKVNDDPKSPWLISLFEQITPTATDWYLSVECDGYVRFSGYILPNTVQIDDTERWVSFTAIGLAGKLSTTSAELASLKRATNSGWTVVETSTGGFNQTVQIAKTTAQSSCEIVSGDTVSLVTPGGERDDVFVRTVYPVGSSGPYASWMLIVDGLDQRYAAGTVVELATPYLRNVPLRTVVDALYVGAGLPATTASTYRVASISGASAPFATVPGQTGLIGTPLGVASAKDALAPGHLPLCGTSVGAFTQGSPPAGSWGILPGDPSGVPAYPVDWRSYGTGTYVLYGPRASQEIGAPGWIHYNFYGYDYSAGSPPGTAYRYRLEIRVDNDAETAATFNYETRLYRERSTNYYTWVADAGPTTAVTGSTTTNLHDEVPLTCGIDVFGIHPQRLVFTEPSSASGSIVYRISTAIPSTLVITAGVFAATRGQVFAPNNGRVGVFEVDGLRGSIPTARFYALNDAGTLVAMSTAAIPTGFQPFTLKYNEGDGYYYALAQTTQTGVLLLSYTSAELVTRAGWTPVELYPPYLPQGACDLTAIRADSWVSGAYPMLAIFGNNLWWISLDFAGIIPYADMEGLSCGDALAQLATLVDAFFYVDRLGVTWFKSRSLASGRTIGTGRTNTSTRIDDDACISLRRAGIWYKAVRFVTIRNENDETIVGTAGDPAFIGNELALEITNRFVYPQSFAMALAEHLFAYLGGALIAVDVEHLDDARDYSIGNSFEAIAGGSLRTFQIVDTTHRPVAGTVRVQGIEI